MNNPSQLEQDKQKVLAVWPDAFADRSHITGFWSIWSQRAGCILSTPFLTEAEAWHDAASKLDHNVQAHEMVDSSRVSNSSTVKDCLTVPPVAAEEAMGEKVCPTCGESNNGCKQFGCWNAPVPSQGEPILSQTVRGKLNKVLKLINHWASKGAGDRHREAITLICEVLAATIEADLKSGEPVVCDACHGDRKSHEDADSNHRIGVCPKCAGEPEPSAPADVYELYDPNQSRVDFTVYRHEQMKDLLSALESAIDDLSEGQEVRIIYRKYTAQQMEEILEEY